MSDSEDEVTARGKIKGTGHKNIKKTKNPLPIFLEGTDFALTGATNASTKAVAKNQNPSKRRRKNTEKKERPVLVLLAGRFWQCSPNVLIDRLMNSIRFRIACNAGMKLRGRTVDRFRIDYDPDAQDVTSIRSRLSRLLHTNESYKSIERLLCPLVATNKEAFSEINTEQLATKYTLTETTYCLVWICTLKKFKDMKPVTWDQRTEVITNVVELVRKHCKAESLFQRA